MGDSRKGVIQSKLEQKPLGSKKAIYALFASICVLIVFAISALLILTHAEVAKDITELANLCVMSFAALATTLITGQAAMDWKAMSVLSHIDEDEKIDSNQELPDQVNERVYKPMYFDDDKV